MDNPYRPPDAASAGTPPRTSTLAIVALTLSCSSVVFGCAGAIGGIVCGHIARRECRRNPHLNGAGLALAALVIGYILTAITALILGYLVYELATEDWRFI